MKKILVAIICLASAATASAQKLHDNTLNNNKQNLLAPDFKIDSGKLSSTELNKYLKPDLTLIKNGTLIGNYNNQLLADQLNKAYKMPVAQLEGKSKMPVVKLKGNSKMPVAGYGLPLNKNKDSVVIIP
ncbi:hypothetical protein ACFQZX_14655 [Mucilaginibacter litoreus]|uniref:Uncharacterized protein n=1 Tax=Mucilaginibacter litoreus TaxID=1048221 RepID=A0ABW3AWU5_9SPHI